MNIYERNQYFERIELTYIDLINLLTEHKMYTVYIARIVGFLVLIKLSMLHLQFSEVNPDKNS